jgi:hypothetical protein
MRIVRKSMGCTSSKAVYYLFVTDWKGDDIFIGSFSTIEKARGRALSMGLTRGAHVDLDVIDAPVDKQKTVWVLEPRNLSK